MNRMKSLLLSGLAAATASTLVMLAGAQPAPPPAPTPAPTTVPVPTASVTTPTGTKPLTTNWQGALRVMRSKKATGAAEAKASREIFPKADKVWMHVFNQFNTF